MLKAPPQISMTREVKIVFIEASAIRANRAQPRKRFDANALESLCDSIKKNGLLQPVSVRLFEDGYEIIAGERRYRACVMAGMKRIPCIVISADNRRAAELALVENLQRRDLGAFEEAEAIAALLENSGMTQEQAAARLSMSQSALANKLRLLRLGEDVREVLLAASLGERHARALLRLPDGEARLSAAKHIARAELNVRQAEDYIARLLTSPPQGKRFGAVKDIRLLVNTVNKALSALRGSAEVKSEAEETEDGYRIITEIKRL